MWELTSQRALMGLRFPALVAADPIELVVEAWRRWELAAKPMFGKLQFPTLPKVEILKSEAEAQREWDLVQKQLLSDLRFPISTPSDGQKLSLTFSSAPQAGDTQIVFRCGDQQITIIESTESAYGVYTRGIVRCLVDILYKRLCSCIETAMHEQFGPDWQERIPKKVRDSCERYRSRDVNFETASNSLLSYGTFKDLCALICLEANWKHAFRNIFLDRDLVKGSFRWFSIVRDKAAHGRSVSRRDRERVFREATHILSILEKSERI